MHKQRHSLGRFKKYLMNQYVIRIVCFPKALSRLKTFWTRVPLGRFSPCGNLEKEGTRREQVVNVLTSLSSYNHI
jgi:hypothetical protein